MLISLSKYTNSDNPKETRVRVKVSTADVYLAKLVESHSFNLQEIQEGRSIAVDVFDLNPNSADLRKYGKKLFRALFSKTESDPAWRLLQDMLRPLSKRRILLDLNGDHDLDIIPWEYAWGNNAYLTRQCIFVRLHNPKGPQPADLSHNPKGPPPLHNPLHNPKGVQSSGNHQPPRNSKTPQPWRNPEGAQSSRNPKGLQPPRNPKALQLSRNPVGSPLPRNPKASQSSYNPPPKLPPLPLRIVTVVPDPIVTPNDPNAKKFENLHLSDQFQALFDGFKKNNRMVLLQRVFPPTVDRMYELLRGKPESAAVLHFMGHCGTQFDGDDARALIFEDQETGGLHFADTLRLDATMNLRLAFLSASETRRVARNLTENGIPYAIGSNCPLPDDLLRNFESKFYQCLASGCTVEKAMLEARASMKDPKDIRQRSYFPGAMVLYSSTFREEDGAFKCERGTPMIEAYMPPHNLEDISFTRFFCGRTEELIKITAVLRRMAMRGTQTCSLYTIEGIAGQGKTALAENAIRRVAPLFPGGIFAWRFDPSNEISAIEYLQGLAHVMFQEDSGNDLRTLERIIIMKFRSYPTSLLILDQADVLTRAQVRGDEGAVALVSWLQKIMLIPGIPVRILATSHQRLRWISQEEVMYLDGFTGLDINSGVELFIRNLDSHVRMRRMEECFITHTLYDLVRLVDGHPLCLESLGHAVGLPQYRNASLEEIIREHFSTILVDGSFGRNLETRFRPTIDALPTQQRLLLYMCSLFIGPITEGVLAVLSYFLNDTCSPSERIDCSNENLQQLCHSMLLSDRHEEYKMHVALREGVRRCNSMMKIRLCLPTPERYDDKFVIGIVKSSKHGISTVLESQLRIIQEHARRPVRNNISDIQYYDIVDIPHAGEHKLEKDGVSQQVAFGGLVVFRRKASEILHASFSKFCQEDIIPIVTDTKSPFIICLKYAASEAVKSSDIQAGQNICLLKKALETLVTGLEKTHDIIWTHLPYNYIDTEGVQPLTEAMDREAILPKPDPNEFKDITSNQSPLNLREAPSKASDPGQIQDKTNDRALSPLESKFSSGEDPTLDGPKNWLQSAIKEGRIEFFDFDEEFNNPIRIAEGGFAKIYHTTGKKLKSKEYALKYLFEQPESAGAFQSLVNEYQLIRKVDDEHFVARCYGISQDPKTNSYILVMKYAEQGALPDYLKKNMGQLSWADKLSLAIQIAEALRYIHSRNVIHRDLHSKNILINAEGRALIADFGLGKLASAKTSKFNPQGRAPYIPPERLSQRAKHDTRGDVFSLGVIFWVISADGGEPFSDLDTMTTAMQINLGFREEPIQGTPEDYVELYSQCWDGDPAKRPKVDEILTRLDAMMKAVLEKEGKGDGFHNTVTSLAPVVSENTLSASLRRQISLDDPLEYGK